VPISLAASAMASLRPPHLVNALSDPTLTLVEQNRPTSQACTSQQVLVVSELNNRSNGKQSHPCEPMPGVSSTCLSVSDSAPSACRWWTSCSGFRLSPSRPHTTWPAGSEMISKSPGTTPPLAISPMPFPECRK